MLEEQRPPDLDAVRTHVDDFMASEGAGHWGPRRARCLLGVVGGRPAFTACVDHVVRRVPEGSDRPLLALATGFTAMAPHPPSQHGATLWPHCVDALAKTTEASPYANREDRRALDLVVVESLRDTTWAAGWEVPRWIVAVSFEASLNLLARGGVDIRLGPIPHSPSILHRAQRLGATVVNDTCDCGGGTRGRPHCDRPDEHRLRAWDPFSLTLGQFLDRAVAGPGANGAGGLREPEAA